MKTEKFIINSTTVFLFLLYLGFFILSCTNPFSTRKAEEPKNDIVNSHLFPVQIEPDSIIKKMELAFSLKEKERYGELFIESSPTSDIDFTFQSQELFQPTLADWNLEDEKRYFSTIIDNTDIYQISLELMNKTQWLQIEGDPNNQECKYDYKIRLNSSNSIEEYRGEVIFKVIKTQLFYIYYWEDNANATSNSDSTWSALKNKYRI